MEPYLARNGGPVILAQIENEYQGSQSYVDWCGQITADLALDIPWLGWIYDASLFTRHSRMQDHVQWNERATDDQCMQWKRLCRQLRTIARVAVPRAASDVDGERGLV